MKNKLLVTIAAVAAVSLLAALPVMAGVVDGARRIEASEELMAFFEDRGVEPMYLGRSQAEMPSDQWKLIVKIVNAPDVEDPDDDEPNLDDDHDVLNSLVFQTLWGSTDADDDPVYITLGDAIWRHECGVEEDEE